MTGPSRGRAKAAFGDEPVRAYLASLAPAQRVVAEAVDALAARTLPSLERSVKWDMAYYGVGDGWCFSCGTAGDAVTLMFINAVTLLDPVPPVSPVGMGKATRGIELHTVADLDEQQVTTRMRQATSAPGVGRNRHQ